LARVLISSAPNFTGLVHAQSPLMKYFSKHHKQNHQCLKNDISSGTIKEMEKCAQPQVTTAANRGKPRLNAVKRAKTNILFQRMNP